MLEGLKTYNGASLDQLIDQKLKELSGLLTASEYTNKARITITLSLTNESGTLKVAPQISVDPPDQILRVSRVRVQNGKIEDAQEQRGLFEL
jgi:DNA-binding GntR family transcriptional regulator